MLQVLMHVLFCTKFTPEEMLYLRKLLYMLTLYLAVSCLDVWLSVDFFGPKLVSHITHISKQLFFGPKLVSYNSYK